MSKDIFACTSHLTGGFLLSCFNNLDLIILTSFEMKIESEEFICLLTYLLCDVRFLSNHVLDFEEIGKGAAERWT